jgi:hypothetical protein
LALNSAKFSLVTTLAATFTSSDIEFPQRIYPVNPTGKVLRFLPHKHFAVNYWVLCNPMLQ